MSKNLVHHAAALIISLRGITSCAESPDSAAHGAEPRGALAAEPNRASAIALSLEQAERRLDTGREILAARAAISAALADPEATPDQRDQAKLALSRVLEAEGDREGAISTVEALLAENMTNQQFRLLDVAERRLRLLLTGSEEEPAPSPAQSDFSSPFARALARYFPVSEAGPRSVSIDVYVFGGSAAVSERLGTFALGPAIRESRKQACVGCDDKLSIKSSFYQTGSWLGIPRTRARLGSSLAVFYFDLGSLRIPARYDAELPLPTADIEARLARGEGLIAVRERKGAPPAILIAAPRRAQLSTVEEALAAMSALPAEPVPVPLSASLATEEVQGVVRGAFPAFRACYEELLARSPAAAGTIPLKFRVRRDGTVIEAGIDAAATLRDAAAEQCMLSATRALRFPAAADETTVTYPVAFSPGEAASAR